VAAKPKTTAGTAPAAATASTVIEGAAAEINEAAASVAPLVTAEQEKMQIGMEKVMKTAEEFVAFSQANIEALVKSSQIWVTGMQDLSKHVAAAAQASVEEGISTFKALGSVKSVKEVFDLQTAFARSTLEKTVAESGKLTDASMKLTEQALAPLTARVTVAVEAFSKKAA
jgi:phasin family protein